MTIAPYATPAAIGLRNAMARNARQKERAGAASAPAKPKAKWTPPRTAAEKAAFRAETDRALTVMSHPNFTGRHKLAAKLLANPKLSAGEVVNLLDLAAATTPAEQDKALAEMQAALAQARASAGGTPAASPATGSAAVWDHALAAVFGSEVPA